MIYHRDGLYRVQLQSSASLATLAWLQKRFGNQGSGWWRTGIDEVSFEDDSLAIEFELRCGGG